LRRLAHIRTPVLTYVAKEIKSAGSGWAVTVVGLGIVALSMIFRRWRHLLVFLGGLFVVWEVAAIMYDGLSRPRPYGVRIIGGWGSFSMPSPPVAMAAILLTGVLYTMVVPGRPRNRLKWVFVGVLALFAFARAYLGVDHPSDILFGAVLGTAIPVGLYRY